MIDRLKAYPVMKDSGVPWVGDVPSGWGVRALRRCGSISGGLTPSMERRDLWGGGIPWVTPKDMKRPVITSAQMTVSAKALTHTSLRAMPPPVVLLVVRGMILAKRVPVAVTSASITINQDMKAIRPYPGVDARFLAHVLEAAQPAFDKVMDIAGHGTRRLPTERWREIEIPVPDLIEQHLIVRFLDHMDRQIRVLIGAKQRMIKLLEEQKRAIIHQAVTRGLNPSVKLKPSGVSWLGDVPEDWQVRRFKTVVRINSGQVDPKLPEHAGRVLVAPNHIKRGAGRVHTWESAGAQGAISGKYEVRAGQIVYSKIRPNLQKAAIVDRDCLCAADMYALSGDERQLRPEFLLALLLSDSFTRYVVDCSLRAAMPKVNREALGDAPLSYPVLAEQDAILAFIAMETGGVRRTVERLDEEIALLREYRTRLISDVVTGKIDVREAAARLPAVADAAAPPVEDEDIPDDLDEGAEVEPGEAEA